MYNNHCVVSYIEPHSWSIIIISNCTGSHIAFAFIINHTQLYFVLLQHSKKLNPFYSISKEEELFLWIIDLYKEAAGELLAAFFLE